MPPGAYVKAGCLRRPTKDVGAGDAGNRRWGESRGIVQTSLVYHAGHQQLCTLYSVFSRNLSVGTAVRSIKLRIRADPLLDSACCAKAIRSGCVCLPASCDCAA